MNRKEIIKEAQEQVNYCTPLYPESYIQGYLAGAEVGYNKCFEQIQKIVDEHTRLDCIITELLRLKESE